MRRTVARRARGTLWQKPRTSLKRKTDPEPHDDAYDVQRKEERAMTLAKEGQLSKACAALLDEPPAIGTLSRGHSQKETPFDSTSLPRHSPLAHLGPRSGRRRGQKEALPGGPGLRSPWSKTPFLFFAPDSAPRPSGLRPQHIEGDLLPGFRDELVRALHAVVSNVAESSWIASASLSAH